MRKNSLTHWIPVTVLIALSGLFFTACQTKDVDPVKEVTYTGNEEPVLVQSVVLNQPIPEEAVKAAVIQSLRGRGWQIKEDAGNEVTAYLLHRKYESTLKFICQDRGADIYSLSYKVDPEKGNKRIKRDEPVGWIRNLHKDILRNLGQPMMN